LSRLRAWLLRRLTQPEIGEIRRFHDIDFELVGYQLDYSLYSTTSLTLQYCPRMWIEDMVIGHEDEVFHDGTG
jgi:hypothetical protein